MSVTNVSHGSTDQRVLLVWDSEERPPEGQWTTVLWIGFEMADSRAISLARMVDARAEEFRGRYLAWVYELGETVIDGARVVDQLEIRPDFSYWWMTSIAQRFNASDKSRVNDAIKAMALEE